MRDSLNVFRPDQKSEASEKKNNQKKKKSDAPVSENRPERKDIERVSSRSLCFVFF